MLFVGILWLSLSVADAFAQTSPQTAANDFKEQFILQIQQRITEQDLKAARTLLAEAARQFPADAGFDNLRGIVEAQEGNNAEAENYFTQAVKRAPKFTGAYLNLGRLYQVASVNDAVAAAKALDVYRRVLAYEPDNAEANFQCAALLMRRGDYQASLARLSRLPAELQQSAQSLAILTADYASLNNRAGAAETAARLLAHPDFSEPDALTILPVLAAGQHDDLIMLLLENLRNQQTSSRQPLSSLAVRYLALAYEHTGRFAEARTALEKTVADAEPAALLPLLMELARLAHRQKDFKGALGYLAHARDVEPTNAAVHYTFGLICLKLNLLAEARNSFEKAVQLEPENAAYNYAMGAASAFRHDPSEAIPYFEKYLKLKPQDPQGKLALGAALFRAKNFAAAAPILTEAVQHSATASVAHYYLGSMANSDARPDDAVRELEAALKIQPDYVDALAELAQSYLIKKDYPQAEKYLNRALALNPNHYGANFNLLTLYARTKDARRAEQAKRFEEIQKIREEKSQELLRIVEVQPFPAP